MYTCKIPTCIDSRGKELRYSTITGVGPPGPMNGTADSTINAVISIVISTIHVQYYAVYSRMVNSYGFGL